MAILRKWQILSEKGKFRQKWRVCEKVIKSLAKYSNEMTKRDILTDNDFTKITNLARIYRFGFYDKFCKIGEFGFIKGLAKILSETTKEAFLVCNQETSQPFWGSIQYSFSRRINMKIEFGSQRREMLLFLTTNMPAVKSSTNQQY